MVVLALLIVLGVPALVILVPQWLRSLERRRILQALTVAAERGAALPADQVGALLASINQVRVPLPPQPDHVRDLRRGVLLLAIMFGSMLIAAAVGALIQAGGETIGVEVALVIASVGAVPGLIGVGYLLLARSGRRAARQSAAG